MNAKLLQTIAEQRIAELQQAAAGARLARDFATQQQATHPSRSRGRISARLTRLGARLGLASE